MQSESSVPGALGTVPPPRAPAGARGGDLDRALTSGLLWTGGMKWGAQAATWAATLLVARILVPADFGLVALSSVYMGVVTLITEFGLGTSVIVLRDLTEEQIARLQGFSIALGGLCFLLSLAAAPLLAAFFRAPELGPVVVVMSFGFILMSTTTLPASLLRRDLAFRALALINGTRALVQAGAMVAFALLGFRYWTLVLGALVGSVFYTVAVLAVRRQRAAWPRRGALRRAMTVSLDVLGSRMSWYLYSNADFVIAGRALGTVALGAYTIAWQIASVPVEKLTTLVVQVMPAVLASVQDDVAALRRYLLRLTEGIALIGFPAAVGLGVVADDFVLAVLTDKYAGAILPLRILAMYAAVRCIAPLFASLLVSVRQTRAVFRNNLLALVVLPVAFLVGSRWGTVGIAAAWAVAHPLVVFQIGRQAFRAVDLHVTEYLGAIVPALVASSAMAGTLLGVRMLLPDDLAVGWALTVQIAVGAATYGAVLFGAYRHRLEAFRRFIANTRTRRPA